MSQSPSVERHLLANPFGRIVGQLYVMTGDAAEAPACAPDAPGAPEPGRAPRLLSPRPGQDLVDLRRGLGQRLRRLGLVQQDRDHHRAEHL